MGFLIHNDVELLREQFKNAASMVGIEAFYCYPVIEEVTIHSEIQSQFSEAIKIDIFFDNPQTLKTMKKMGWVAEGPNDTYIMAQLPFDTPHLQTKSRVFIPPVGQAFEGEWFEVTEINANLEYPDCYYCKLAPLMSTEKPKIDRDQINFAYVNHERANQPDQDNPNNYPVNANFKFLTGI